MIAFMALGVLTTVNAMATPASQPRTGSGKGVMKPPSMSHEYMPMRSSYG